MADDNQEQEDTAEESTAEMVLIDTVGNWKVLGKFSDSSGAGVLGHNTSGSGDAIGVQGVTDSSSGYGLHTPDDAKVEGVAELSTLSGSLTGGANISDLTGSGLTIDSGSLKSTTGVGTYKTKRFTSAGTTWDALTGLASETPVEITVDTWNLNNGRVNIEIDGNVENTDTATGTTHRMYGASSSVTITTDEAYSSSKSVDVSGTSGSPVGVAFKDDGSRMYLSDTDGYIDEWELSTPWDVSSAAYKDASFPPSSPTEPRGLAFRGDGEKLVIGGDSGGIYAYDLSTGWSITSAGNEQVLDTALSRTSGVDVKSDGSKLYVTDSNQSDLYSYELSTPWDITTAGNRTSYTFSGTRYPAEIIFTNSGESLYMTEDDGARVLYEYKLSTPWDISTITEVDSIWPQGGPSEVTGIWVRSDDARMYVTHETNGEVYQYDEAAFDGTVYASVQKE